MKDRNEPLSELGEKHFKRIFENSRIGIVLTNPKGHIIKANQKAQDLFEYSEEELRTMPFSEFTHPDDVGSNLQVFNRLVNGELDYYEFDKRYITKSGKTIWVSLTSSAIEDENGELEYALTTLQEVSVRKQVEFALKESEKKLTAILDNLPGMAFMYEVGQFDNPSFISEGCEVITGFTTNEIYSEDFKWSSRVPEDDVIRTQEMIVESISRKEPVEIAYPFTHKDGSLRWFMERSRPVFDEKGNPTAIEGIVFDISDLKEYQSKLEESLHEKEIMLQEIHHRVKNNMAIVSGLLELQRYSFDDDQLAKVFQNNIMRIKSIALVHEALYKSDNFSKIKLGSFLQDLVENERLVSEGAAKKIDFEIHGSDEVININLAVPIGLIVNELISNAIEHGYQKGEQGKVVISFQSSGEERSIRISNDGNPLPKDFEISGKMGLGMNIISVLCTQIAAHLEIEDFENPSFILKFRKEDKKGPSSAFY